jgi:hypothetical protein
MTLVQLDQIAMWAKLIGKGLTWDVLPLRIVVSLVGMTVLFFRAAGYFNELKWQLRGEEVDRFEVVESLRAATEGLVEAIGAAMSAKVNDDTAQSAVEPTTQHRDSSTGRFTKKVQSGQFTKKVQ